MREEFQGCSRLYGYLSLTFIVGWHSSDIKELIVCRRYETSTLHHVLQGFSTSECDWLIPPGEGARKQHRVSVTDSLKRRELLEEFLFWFYDSFLLPLLRVSILFDSDGDLLLTQLFPDNVLCYRVIRISEAHSLLSARWLGDSLCTPDRPIKRENFPRDREGMSWTLIGPPQFLYFCSMKQKRSCVNDNSDFPSFVCCQRKPVFAPLWIYDEEQTQRSVVPVKLSKF
jgi:hypothetical protein